MPLSGGHVTGGVVRVGDMVRRPMTASSAAVHDLLGHLDRVGFDGAPRVLGVDDLGREILCFHPGPMLIERFDLLSSDDGYARYARLVAAFHAAAESYDCPPDAAWSPIARDPVGGPRMLHGDLGPWNVVAGDDRWVIIDWDGAAPGRLEWELAYILQVSVPLFPGMGLDDAEVTRRVNLFASAYGMSAQLLDAALDLVPDRCRATLELIESRAAAGDPSFVRMVDEGHATLWSTAVTHVDDAVPRWRALVTGRSIAT